VSKTPILQMLKMYDGEANFKSKRQSVNQDILSKTRNDLAQKFTS